VVEIGQGHDQLEVVLEHERPQRIGVRRVVDPRDERVRVGVVERGRELVDVRRERPRSGAAERRDDVDALPCAREEDGAHGPRGYRRPVLRWVLFVAAALVAAWLVACLVLFVWPPAESNPPGHADAVIVLSGDKKRLPPALDLVRKGVAPVLAISTVERTKHWAAARRLCAAGRYAGARVLCFDAVPFSTQGEARTVARLARERGWRSIVVVTSTFHVTRATMLFHRCFHGDVDTVGTGSTWWKLPEEWAFETGKLLVQLTVRRSC
jgi:uncharacterized SAM-binding protein YcdF (DUF218 family)